MDISERIDLAMERESETYKKELSRVNKRLEVLNADLKKLSAFDLSSTTNAISKLMEANGHTVKITVANSEYEDTFTFENGKINTSAHGSYPLLGEVPGSGIIRIIDKETGKSVFYNPYTSQRISYQFAYVLGKDAGLKEVNLEIDDATISKSIAETRHKDVEQSLLNAQKNIERGAKCIYPQRKDAWAVSVIDDAEIYHVAEMEKALEIMELLSQKNSKIQDAVKLYDGFSSDDSGHAIVRDIVTNYSKRGPEFYKEATHTEKLPKWVQKIEENNQKFERELSDSGKQ